MESLVIVIHVVVALAIIGLILLQQGKGAEAGASFGGGASQTVFGSQGSGNFFAKFTAILAVLFFVTSFSLAIIAKNKATIVTSEEGIPAVEQEQESEVPSVVTESADPSSEIPILPSEETSSVSEEAPSVNQQ